MSRTTLRIRPLPLTIAALAAAALLAAAPLVAQPHAAGGAGHEHGRGHGPGHHLGAGGHGGHHGMHGLFGGRGVERLARHLELSEEQRAQASAIHEATRDRFRVVGEESRQLRRQLRELLEQPAPDATAVGGLVISLDANRDRVRQLHEEARASFEAILTAEQLAKLEELEESRDERRGRRGERGRGRAGGEGGGVS